MYFGWSNLTKVMHEERIRELLEDHREGEPRWKIWPRPVLGRVYQSLKSSFGGRRSKTVTAYPDCAQPEKAS